MLDPTSGETFFIASISSLSDWVYKLHKVTATEDWSIYFALHFQCTI